MTSDDPQLSAAKSRRLLAIAAATGLAGVGLLYAYLRRFEEQVSGGARVQVLSIVQPVERGQLIGAEALAVSEVPIAYVEQRAVRASERGKVVGIRAAHGLDAHDTLLWTDLAISQEQRDLSSLVQPGKRAVTVRANEAGSDPAGSGLVRPGDYVDVLVTLKSSSDGAGQALGAASVVLLQRVLVLAVGSQTEPQAAAELRDARPTGHTRERELTLSLKTEEVQLLSLARERGVLSVALRDPTDTQIVEGIPDMSLAVLYDKKSRESVQAKKGAGRLPVRIGEARP